MDDQTLSDPIAVERGELQQLEQDLAALARVSGDLLGLLRRAQGPDGGPPADGGNALAQASALQTAVRAAQQRHAAAVLGLDAIAQVAESRRQEAAYLRTLYTVG